MLDGGCKRSMPLLLKKDSIRLFEASVESLSLAIAGLGLPIRIEIREQAARNAAPIGLIGVAAELAMSGILVQAMGQNSLLLASGHYKSGHQILDDFRRLLRNPVPRTAFITQGVANPAAHLQLLYDQTLRFKLLISTRAGGLHAGQGPSRDICIVTANDVVLFLSALRQSSRIKPYLPHLPIPPEIVRERTLILEDLARSLHQAGDPATKGRLLSSIYLVLPEMPTEQPEWIEAFERVSIAPGEEDISYLLNVLETSSTATLIRVAGSGQTLPVAVRPSDPNALPIAPQFLRRAFTQFREQWYADIGNANGRLEQGTFDCPPNDYVLELYVLGFESVEVLQSDQQMTGHEAWPFIASSLAVSGTSGPYWFLIRRTADMGQLKACLERAISFGPAYLRNNADELMAGLEAIQLNRPLSPTVPFVSDLLLASQSAERRREQLGNAVLRNVGTPRELGEEPGRQVTLASQGDISIGNVLRNLVEDRLGITDDRSKGYWARMLTEAADEEEDLGALLAVLRTRELVQAHTAAKKAIRLIDFLSYGPNIEQAVEGDDDAA